MSGWKSLCRKVVLEGLLRNWNQQEAVQCPEDFQKREQLEIALQESGTGRAPAELE